MKTMQYATGQDVQTCLDPDCINTSRTNRMLYSRIKSYEENKVLKSDALYKPSTLNQYKRIQSSILNPETQTPP